MNKIRLLLMEENHVLRKGIAAMLKGHRDINLIAASSNGENCIARIHELKPGVILLDMDLRNQKNVRVVEILKKALPRAKVIVMNLGPAQGDILQYVKAGASGFLLKNSTPEDFLATIRSVAGGGQVLPPVLNDSLFSEITQQTVNVGQTNLNKAILMSMREREVIGLITEGLTNKEIAGRLHVATETVKSHVQNILGKLAIHSRLQIAIHTRDETTN
jgi:DNA-binding NarL/FixJ family response regulator